MKTILVVTMLALAGVLNMTGCAVTSGQSTMGEYVDDAAITTRVKARHAEDSQVNAIRVSVETLNGEVQLSGFATNETEKMRAEQLAREVKGVKNVKNGIVVRPADSASK